MIEVRENLFDNAKNREPRVATVRSADDIPSIPWVRERGGKEYEFSEVSGVWMITTKTGVLVAVGYPSTLVR